ncbi:MAG: hypothetical protein SGJ20_22175 [Planctomycetota bacterium]|nr:hypothetical protein [Planctomycetota bacterium]
MRPITLTIWLLFLPTLVGCAEKGPATSKLSHYHGLSREAVIARLGAPSYDQRYVMQDAIGEFRVELQNTYPLTDPKNYNVQIQELWWHDDTHTITLWLHQVNDQWTVLNSCRWEKVVEF